jgi:hypothetical protein
MDTLFYRLLYRVFLITFIYLILSEVYCNIILFLSIYERIIQLYSIKYKHTSYIYDCLYANCFHENDYLKCKCLIER